MSEARSSVGRCTAVLLHSDYTFLYVDKFIITGYNSQMDWRLIPGSNYAVSQCPLHATETE